MLNFTHESEKSSFRDFSCLIKPNIKIMNVSRQILMSAQTQKSRHCPLVIEFISELFHSPTLD